MIGQPEPKPISLPLSPTSITTILDMETCIGGVARLMESIVSYPISRSHIPISSILHSHYTSATMMDLLAVDVSGSMQMDRPKLLKSICRKGGGLSAGLLSRELNRLGSMEGWARRSIRGIKWKRRMLGMGGNFLALNSKLKIILRVLKSLSYSCNQLLMSKTIF